MTQVFACNRMVARRKYEFVIGFISKILIDGLIEFHGLKDLKTAKQRYSIGCNKTKRQFFFLFCVFLNGLFSHIAWINEKKMCRTLIKFNSQLQRNVVICTAVYEVMGVIFAFVAIIQFYLLKNTWESSRSKKNIHDLASIFLYTRYRNIEV